MLDTDKFEFGELLYSSGISAYNARSVGNPYKNPEGYVFVVLYVKNKDETKFVECARRFAHIRSLSGDLGYIEMIQQLKETVDSDN